MFAGLARGLMSGARAGMTGSFMRSAAGARGYMAGHTAGAFMRTPTGMGMAAGAGWGAMSNDTSVIGGALMGAGVGRYGAAGLRMANRGGAGMGLAAHARSAGRNFGLGAYDQARRDFSRSRLMSNNGINKIRSSLKGNKFQAAEVAILSGTVGALGLIGVNTYKDVRNKNAVRRNRQALLELERNEWKNL